MNFRHLHDRVRVELLRRMERGTLSVSLLARQTGLTQAHISNFLHGHRSMSMDALDKVLAAIRMPVEDLMVQKRGYLLENRAKSSAEIPLVPHAVAIFEPYMRASVVERMLSFPGASLADLEPRCSSARKIWERFVAIHVDAEDAQGMEPVLLPGAVVLLDRHYTSFKPMPEALREDRPNLYAARFGSQLLIRYAQYQADRVVLRPYRAQAEAHVIEIGVGETANDVLVGRVVRIVNEP
jgi:transcriptional regulator with XRE-family HTH domain